MTIKDGLGTTCCNFRNNLIVLITLVKIVLIWMSKDNFESKCGLHLFSRNVFENQFDLLECYWQMC